MKRNVRKFLKKQAAILIIVCAVLAMTACKKSKPVVSRVVADVGNKQILLDEAGFFAYMEQANYEAYYLAYGKEINWGEEYEAGKTFEALVKEETLNMMIKQKVFLIKAEELGITPDDTDKSDIEKQVAEFMGSSDKELLDRINASEDLVRKVYGEVKIYEKLCDKTLLENPIEVTDEEAKQGKFTVCVADPEKTESVKETAEAVLARVKAGETIDYVANVYGLDKTTGNVGKGDLNNDIEKTCLSLQTGESGIASVDGYYYVIYCDSDYDKEASEIAKEQLKSQKESEVIEKYYTEIKENIKISVYDKVYDTIKFDKKLFTMDDMQTNTGSENNSTDTGNDVTDTDIGVTDTGTKDAGTGN